MINLLQQWASGRNVLVSFVAANIVYAIMLLRTLPMLKSMASGQEVFDLRPTGYSYIEALNLMQALGTEGRHLYLTMQIPLDFLYPGLFALCYSLMTTWFLKNSVRLSSKLFYLAIPAVIGGLLDYLENISIIALLQSFPDVSPGLVQTASTLSILKSIAHITSFTLLFVSMILFAKEKLRRTEA